MDKAYNGRLPSTLIDCVVKKRDLSYSITKRDSLLVPRFNTFYEGVRRIQRHCPLEHAVFQIH